jgi:hypothetical protein
MRTKKSPAQLVPADVAVDATVVTLIGIFRFWAEGIRGGNFAFGDLPTAAKLQALPPWVAAWDRLTDAEKEILNARWWSAKPLPFA